MAVAVAAPGTRRDVATVTDEARELLTSAIAVSIGGAVDDVVDDGCDTDVFVGDKADEDTDDVANLAYVGRSGVTMVG